MQEQLTKHWAELKRLAQSLLKDESVAEDVLQTAFVKALTTQSGPRDEKSILPWFKTIIKRTALDVFRKQKRERENLEALGQDILGQGLGHGPGRGSSHGIGGHDSQVRAGTFDHGQGKANIEPGNVDTHAFETAVCNCVLAFLKELSPDDQHLLNALDIEEQPLKDVAKTMGKPANTIKVRRHRARKRLKQLVVKACNVQSTSECLDCDC